MATYTPQDGRGPLPHGNLRLLELTKRSEPLFLDVWYYDAPIFNIVTYAATASSRGPRDLDGLLHTIRNETGIAHFLLKSSLDQTSSLLVDVARHIPNKVARTIIWLGPSADDSDTAIRCLSRLQSRRPATASRRLWSRREGQALLALAERPTWRQFSPHLLANSEEPWLCAGNFGVSWAAVLKFRQLLSDVAARGRMEHHHFAHALLASKASEVIGAFVDSQDVDAPHDHDIYPPPIPQIVHLNSSEYTLQELSSQLEQCISTVESRWTMLEQELQVQATPETLSDIDLDVEIEKYTLFLEQMDVLEMDLQNLDDLATATNVCYRQAEAHTPRASPEIMP